MKPLALFLGNKKYITPTLANFAGTFNTLDSIKQAMRRDLSPGIKYYVMILDISSAKKTTVASFTLKLQG